MYVRSFIPQLGEKSGNRVGGSNNNNNNPLCYVVNSPNLEMETGAWKLVHFASSQMNGLQHTSLFVMRGGPGYPYKLLLITTVVGMGSHTVTSGVGSRRLLFLSVWGPILIQKALTTTPVWCPAPAPNPHHVQFLFMSFCRTIPTKLKFATTTISIQLFVSVSTLKNKGSLESGWFQMGLLWVWETLKKI